MHIVSEQLGIRMVNEKVMYGHLKPKYGAHQKTYKISKFTES